MAAAVPRVRFENAYRPLNWILMVTLLGVSYFSG
jgi:hypothetical protein